MGTQTAAERGPARKLDRTRPLHVSLPAPRFERLTEAAERLHVSRSLLVREAVTDGLKAATDRLRRIRQREQRHQQDVRERVARAIRQWPGSGQNGGAETDA